MHCTDYANKDIERFLTLGWYHLQLASTAEQFA